MTPSTQFATRRNPWTGAQLPQEMTMKKPLSGSVDVDSLTLANDPLPTGRIIANKYRSLLSQMKVGQCIRCKPGEVQQIGSAVRKHIEMNGIKVKGRPVRAITQSNAADGVGRVWMVEDDRKGVSP